MSLNTGVREQTPRVRRPHVGPPQGLVGLAYLKCSSYQKLGPGAHPDMEERIAGEAEAGKEGPGHAQGCPQLGCFPPKSLSSNAEQQTDMGVISACEGS